MDWKPIIILVLFGLVMIIAGEYRRQHAHDEEIARLLDGDPLVNAIKEYNQKKDEKSGGLSGMISKSTNAIKGNMGSSMGAGGALQPLTESGEEVADDAFSPPTATPQPTPYVLKKDLRPGRLPTAGSIIQPNNQPENSTTLVSPSFYPPLIQQQTDVTDMGNQDHSGSKPTPEAQQPYNSYYPPSAAR